MSTARHRVIGLLKRHAGLAFCVMGMAFVGFAMASYNLVSLLAANLALFWQHGWLVVQDGALRQLFELAVSGYLALAFYLVVKACEKILVEKLTSQD
ncbi:hypothetical protein ABWL39_08115 [Chitinivorax sp. PXF-14]|uniref:hypothetical protein n=1 Tax=Chitinivorax sp. PXF-14 TaxID=3230488 RepID=UPI003467787C